MIGKLKRLINRVKLKFNSIYQKVIEFIRKKKMEKETNKYNFQKLTPHDEVELKIYEDAMNYIFDNRDIVNVAVSGSYGSGKSSVIASYKKLRKDLRFVHVSLAHFKSHDEKEKEKEKKVNESVLEGKIINQLIHQIPIDKIPQTHFKVKQKVKMINYLSATTLTMLLIISLFHILFFSKWSAYVALLPSSSLKDLFNITTHYYSPLVSVSLLAIICCIFIYQFVKLQMNKNVFKKLNIQGNEIEIFEESKESYFDKYLNEVLYLFENINADVIVFEDIDRFNENRIFERLREINTLANIQTKKKSPIRFFYLLRDDIFISKDRTKFFDYTVPIVPVVDSSNSYDQFISHFKEGGILNLFDGNFLQGVSLYIDDMRILKNIYNEFIIYYNRLNTTELDCNKMLSIIIYKNLFPRDFSQLQLNQGMVYALFNNKDQYIENEIKRLNVLAEQKRTEIINIKKEHLVSIQELKDVYSVMIERIPWHNHQIRQEAEKKRDVNYPIREEAINNKINNRLSEVENELRKIELEIVATETKQLKEIITRKNIDSIFKISIKNEIGVETNFHEIKGSDYFSLLKYLIRNGYIDETYPDYMTYFYENSLSRVDKTFLRSITDKKAKEYIYQLKNPQMVIKRLRLVDFDQEEILNFSLLEFLLSNLDYENFLNRFLSQLKETKNFTYIGAYFDIGKKLEFFVRHLNKQWPEMLKIATEQEKLTKKQIRLYSVYTLYYSEIDEILNVNVEGFLSDYISSSNDYLDINEPNIDKLIEGFIALNVSFEKIDSANDNLLEYIYNNSLYTINLSNLELMLKKYYEYDERDDFYQRNYTLVRSQPESPLNYYIHDNFDEYIKVVIKNNRDGIKDDESSVLLILENETISVEHKIEYIDLLITKITRIIDVKDKSLWSLLLDKHLMEYSEENLLYYFEYSETLDKSIIEYINSYENQLNFNSIKNMFEEKKIEEFFDAIIVCNQISNEKYMEILVALNYSYEVFDIEGITNEKFIILVDKGFVPMDLETLQFVRKNYSEGLIFYINKNIVDYANLLNEEVFLIDEVLNVLALDISDDIKIRLLKLTNEPLSISRKEYSESVLEHILLNNFKGEDLPYLCINYDNWSQVIQQIIYQLACNNVSRIIGEKIKLSRQLLDLLLESTNLDIVEKIDLFISSINNMNTVECKKYLDLLNLTEYKKIFEPRTRPKFEINDVNQKLLTAFRIKGWIGVFYEDDKKDGFYKVEKTDTILKNYERDSMRFN